MKVQPDESQDVTPSEVAVVAALAAWAAGPQELLAACKGVWPKAYAYEGGTHWRLCLDGNSHGKSVYVDLVKEPTPDFLPVLPDEVMHSTNEELADRYYHLAEIKIAGETRVGRHPSGIDESKNVEQDAAVREVLDAGLRTIVREMAAVQWELNQRPGGLAALLPDGPWKQKP